MAAIRTQDGRVLTINGRAACRCCIQEPPPPPPPPSGEPCYTSNTLSLPFGVSYPPPEGVFTAVDYHETFHLTHDEFLYYSTTPATLQETTSLRYEYDLTATIGDGRTLLLENRKNTGVQSVTYQPPNNFCGVFVFDRNRTYSEAVGSRLKFSEQGLYSDCGIPFSDEFSDPFVGSGSNTYTIQTSVILVEDVRNGVANENKVHLMLLGFYLQVESQLILLRNPFNSSQIIWAVRSRLYYDMKPTFVTGSPLPPLPSGATESKTITMLGKNLTLYPAFSATALPRFFGEPCWIDVTNISGDGSFADNAFSNVVFDGSYTLDFVPNAP
jgi:hypothetical protein